MLLRGHCHLNGHLFKLRLEDSHRCGRCHQTLETVSHVLCGCEALAVLRFRHLSHHFLKPGSSANMSISKTLQLVQSAELLHT
jgi:hypothetical protein